MNKTLSVSVTPEQYNIIKNIAEANKCSVSSILKDSIQMRIILEAVSEIVSKIGVTERTMKDIERDSKIAEHAESMVNLMQPYFQRVFSGLSPELIKALGEDGKELEKTVKLYNKPVKRGRRPVLIASKNGEA